jgi:hypothetical protein
MYGDTMIIRRLARDLREQAIDIRAEARALDGKVQATTWTGRAADAMRTHATGRLIDLQNSATRHDDAADALDHHADEVDRLKDLISAIERRAHRIIEAAVERLEDLGGRLLDGIASVTPDPIDEAIDRFVPPPPGHKDWLTVDLPGLGN